MNFFTALDKNFEKWLISCLLIFITILSALQVVMRYCFNNALPWVEEVVVYMNVWIGFLGCSYAMQQDIALRVDFGPLLPKRLSDAMKTVADLATVCCYLFFCYVGYGIVSSVYQRGLASPAAEIPVWVLYASLLCGSGLAIVRWLQRALKRASKHTSNTQSQAG